MKTNRNISQCEPVDVVVVGSGIAGSTMTAELVEAGFQVLTLEGGPERSVDQMISSQIWSRRHKWSGPAIESEGDLLSTVNFGLGWGTGGAGYHWYGNWFRFHENDFKEQSLYGKGLDWPIDYNELRPYYDRAQKDFGVSGDLSKEPWAPPADDYPMRPLRQLPQSRAIKKGFDALGFPVSPNSLAINSRNYEGRNRCLYDGWCDAGCPIGALANPLVLQWPRALRAGARLKHDAYVTRVTTDASGKKATGVEYRDAEGELCFQPASIVIVAASAIPTVRLLLLSGNSAHTNGLANASGLLGQHYMTHPAIVIYGLFKERTKPHRGVAGANILSQHNYDDKQPSADAFGSRQWMGGQTAKVNDLLGIAGTRVDLYGSELDRFLRKATKHFGSMTALCEETSLVSNRIELDGSVSDQFGLPLAKIFNNIPAENAARVELAREEGHAIFRAANTTEVWHGDRIAIHEIGGTLMGDDPATSVTDSYGQTHDVENLFVAGSSLFPTSGAVNPTATLAALALRSVDYIIENRHSLIRLTD